MLARIRPVRIVSICCLFLLLGIVVWGQDADAPEPDDILQVPMLVLPSDPNAPDWAEEQRRTYERLALDFAKLAYSQALSVVLTAEDRERLGNQDCASCIAGQALIIGLEKEVGARIEFPLADVEAAGLGGKHLGPAWVRQLPSGEVAATIALRAKGATMMRVHLTDLELPEGVELFLYSQEGEVFGPWTGTGPHKSGEFWTNTLSSPEGFIEIRGPAWGGFDHFAQTRLTIRAISAIDPDAARGANQTDADKSYCGLESCFRDARCVSSSEFGPLNDAKRAIARLYFQVGGETGICTGQLLNTTQDISSPYDYLLTANHCFSTQASASSLECIWDYENSTCGGCRGLSGLPRTLGSTLLATSTTTDFTFVRLVGSVPTATGRVWLGWDSSTNVATANGMVVHRLGHPMGRPLSYSRHQVATSGLTCSGFARGNYIYSAQVSGAIRGGSSGSALLNSQGQVVGQLFGACTINQNPCTYERIVDGAFRVTFPSIRAWLAPPPNQPINPSPPHGATGQPVNPTLSWSNGGGAERYDVYLGTQQNLGTADRRATDRVETWYAPPQLAYSETYFWRVDAKNSSGTTTGAVWRFGTRETIFQPPARAVNPVPVNGATDQPRVVTLRWQDGGSAQSYDLYLGTSQNLTASDRRLTSSVETRYTTPPLALNESYFWRVDSRNAAGTTTGSVWQFRTFVADDSYEPNNSWQEGRQRPAIRPGDHVGNLRSFDEDWYRILIGSEESVRIRVLFSHASGNLNAELYDVRSLDRSGWPFRVGESYSPNHPWVWNPNAGDGPAPVWTNRPWGPATSDDEWITYVNNTGATELILRVYGQDWESNPDYSIAVDSLGSDDQFEPNNEPHEAATIQIGTRYEGLIGKDNDFYRVNTSGRTAIRVRVACYALLGTMYFEVYRRLPDGGYAPIEAGKMYEPNRYEAQRVVCVQGLSEVFVRVYPSVRMPNVYNLTVENVATCPTAKDATEEATPKSNWIPEGAWDESAADPLAAILRWGQPQPANALPDDSYEPNNSWHDARQRPALRPGQTATGLRSYDEDWYRIELGAEESVRIRVLFLHANGNLNAELYDLRSFDRSGWPFRVGESYSPNHPWVWNPNAGDGPAPVWTTLPWGPATANDEWITYVNNSGATELFLRVYGQNWETNDNYSVAITSLGADDQFEPNNAETEAATIQIGTRYEGLIGKDNDFYRVSTSGRTAIRVRVACYALLGTMYFEVYRRLPDGGYQPIEQSKMYEPNRYEAQRVVCVQGLSEVFVRVYPSVRMPNVYNLVVENVNTCP